MSRFASIGDVPAKFRAQVEAKLAGRVRTVTPMSEARSKYGNKRCVVDGLKFASQKEARRYAELQLREKAGFITDLRRQVSFELTVNGVEICVYRADAVYRQGCKLTVEDTKGYTKGMAYRLFKIKQSLMLALHKIEVIEV